MTAGLVAALANYLTARRGKFGMGKPIEDDPADTDHPGPRFASRFPVKRQSETLKCVRLRLDRQNTVGRSWRLGVHDDPDRKCDN